MSFGPRIAIASSTNAGPIHVIFSSAHGAQSGDWCQIEGHAVNSAANGFWPVQKVSSTELILLGSLGNGVGVATGYGSIVSKVGGGNPRFDGDVIKAYRDPVPRVQLAAGRLALLDVYDVTVATNTWGGVPNSTTVWAIVGDNALSLPSPVPQLQTGDVLDIDMRGAIALTGSGSSPSNGFFTIGVKTNGGGLVAIPGSKVAFREPTASALSVPCALRARYVASGPATSFDVGVMGINDTTPDVAMNFLFGIGGTAKVIVEHWRPT